MATNLPGPYDPRDDDYPDLPEASTRSRSVAVALGLVGGVFGLHRFYAGRVQSGVYMVLTLGGLGVWWLYDMVMLVSGEFRDADDRPIRTWPVAEVGEAGGASGREVEQLRERFEQMQHQLGELAERMDFAERMLTQQRERNRLGS
jgi:hypothetical protein